jgi:HJR/Mrr/RecB family endonuclease
MTDGDTWHVRLDIQLAYPSPAVKATVVVLLEAGGGPLTYRELTERAVRRGLWSGSGHTPWNTLARDLRTDKERAAAAGCDSIFHLTAGPTGPEVLVSLDLAAAGRVDASERRAEREAVLEEVRVLHPRAFEELVGALVWRMGFKNVTVTPYSNDGGVDIRASYSCGPVCDQRFVFEVKRWERPVGGRTMRLLRGTLAADEQGVLVTTGDFSEKATRLAGEWLRPIVCIDGDRLAELLINHEVPVGTATSPPQPARCSRRGLRAA